MERRKPQLASKIECTGCLACTDSCLHDALHYYIGGDGHYYINVDYGQCIGCLACEKICPIVSGQKYGESECAKFYAAWNNDDTERKRSASGGAFSAMSSYIIDHGGVVIGAATENICDVRHEVITNKEGITRIQGSKYTQSDTGGIYSASYQLLKEGKAVLFSGTGCQIGGLLSYLKNKKYDGRLITVDLICGGVPSKLLLQKFMENEPYKVKKILSWRTKEYGWKSQGFAYNMKVEEANGRVHDYIGKRNLVTTGFCSELTERYSCYDCKFVGKRRLSDFTIGDLWGDKEFQEEHYKGLSLIIAHNRNSDELLTKMKTYLQTHPCNEEGASKANTRLVNGYNCKKYTLERRFVKTLFSSCSYNTLKKIYADDYNINSPWMILKITRKIWIQILKNMERR